MHSTSPWRRRQVMAALAGSSVGLAGCMSTNSGDNNDLTENEPTDVESEKPFVCEGLFNNGGSYRESPESGALIKYDSADSNLQREFKNFYGVEIKSPIQSLIPKKIPDSDARSERSNTVIGSIEGGFFWQALERVERFEQGPLHVSKFNETRDYVDYCNPNGHELLHTAVEIGVKCSNNLWQAASEVQKAAKGYLDEGLHEVEFQNEEGEVLFTRSVGVSSHQFDPEWTPNANRHYNNAIELLSQSISLYDEVPNNIRERIMVYDPGDNN